MSDESKSKPSRTEAQREASRRNGARSQGPKTDDGKAASSQNALKHGLTSLRVTIEGEKIAEWRRFRDEYLDHYQPHGPVERDTVEQLAYCAFRIKRLMPLESAKIDSEQAKLERRAEQEFTGCDRPLKQSMAYENSIKQLEFLSRYETRLKRQLKEHIATIDKLQQKRKAEEKAAEAARQEAEAPKTPNEPERGGRFLSINQMIEAGLAPGLSPKNPWNRTIRRLQELNKTLPPPPAEPDAA